MPPPPCTDTAQTSPTPERLPLPPPHPHPYHATSHVSPQLQSRLPLPPPPHHRRRSASGRGARCARPRPTRWHTTWHRAARLRWRRRCRATCRTYGCASQSHPTSPRASLFSSTHRMVRPSTPPPLRPSTPRNPTALQPSFAPPPLGPSRAPPRALSATTRGAAAGLFAVLVPMGVEPGAPLLVPVPISTEAATVTDTPPDEHAVSR